MRFCLRVALLLLPFSLLCFAFTHARSSKTTFEAVSVPEIWRKPPRGKLASKDGFAWYRCWAHIPSTWKGRDISIYVEPVDDARAVYVNGTRVGAAGTFPPRYRSGLNEPSFHKIPRKLLRFGQVNFIALRVYYLDGRTNFSVSAPTLIADKKEAIRLSGSWQAKGGDDATLANAPKETDSRFVYSKVEKVDDLARFIRRRKGDHDPYPPKKALTAFNIPNDLKLDLVANEPEVCQPLFVNFDERGRMWVMQYLQYPDPAGLKMISRDKYLRTVYDKVPPAPPNHFKGRDKITIHEDTDGDGIFDKHKTFVEGLSIATSFARGRGGVWVLNPPYLLFYPDKNNDDVPDGDPVVHLSGFGIEDSHSVANSLRWGPDGWLYAAQGSTVTGHIKRPGIDKEAVHSMGQLIWRYHPEKKIYEIFAEGGGNTFGVEIDSKGRIYSGHNGGDTRGFHYVQGGYYRKGFNKHGSLSNPYAFGYFPSMKHHSVPRFTHNFVIYEGGTLPTPYRDQLFGIEPLQGQIVQSEVSRDGSTFKTRDISRVVRTGDQWFRPVDIKVGPDGGVYFCDLYEQRIDHSSHYAGRVDRTNGRIYRLRGVRDRVDLNFDYGKASSKKLVTILGHPNKWHRQTALRVLGDRKDRSVIPMLKKQIEDNKGQVALDSLWALHQVGGLTEKVGGHLITHPNPYVRLWTVRLLCDNGEITPDLGEKLGQLARREKNVEVRSQLACSARRLGVGGFLSIIKPLLTHDEDLADPHVPLLLWWAIEKQASRGTNPIHALFKDQKVWELPLVRKVILERLMRRFAQAGRRKNLLMCATLLKLAPKREHLDILMKGFELAFKGRSLPRLPDEMIEALARVGGGSLPLQLRQGKSEAVDKALKLIQNAKTRKNERLQLIRILGQIVEKKSVPALLQIVKASRDDSLQQASLLALQGHKEASIAREILSAIPRLSSDSREVALNLLASRESWAKSLIDAVSRGAIKKDQVASSTARKLLLHGDKALSVSVKKIWGDVEGATTEQMRQEIERLTKVIKVGSGNPYKGRTIFANQCAKCHTLFGRGGSIGPDLTSYQRGDLNSVLVNVVNPSADIREGFENYLVETSDGRVVTGFLADEDNRVVVIRDADGQNRVIPKAQIEEKRALSKSLMPEDLLKKLSEQQVRDLFAYLRATQPLP